MLRLLSIEFFKLKNSRYFWILSGLFLVLLMSIPYTARVIVNTITREADVIDALGGLSLPFFDFVDVWQNLTFIFKFFSIFLGFITVISVSSEFSYGMLKQNVIDGLSRAEFLWTKVLMIVVLSAVMSIVALLIGLYMGYMYSPVTEWTFVTAHIEFIPAYFLHLVAFQLFCLVVTLLIKRSGIVIAALFFYVLMIEPLLGSYMSHHGMALLAEFLPVNAISNIIRFPFYKYAMRETQTTIGMMDLSILIGYIGLLTFVAHRMLTKRDLA
jgi:ABC-type transport system involved in multi-copper enzyme maturation permease subunit